MNSTEIPICVRAGSSEPPVFLVHDGFGQLFYSELLAAYFSGTAAVYALPAEADKPNTLRTIEGMAQRMVHMIQTVQPRGPYRIAGLSFGGTLAYAIATHLICQDHEIAFLGLIEPSYCAVAKPSSQRLSQEMTLTDALMELVEYAGSPVESQALGQSASVSQNMSLMSLLHKCEALSLVPERLHDSTYSVIHEQLSRAIRYQTASSEYCAIPIGIPVHFFSAMDTDSIDALRGWGSLIPPTFQRLVRVPGNRRSIMEQPNVKMLGALLSDTISLAEQRAHRISSCEYCPVIPLQVNSWAKPPLFMAPGAGCSVPILIELVNRLDKSVAVYGLQPRGLDSSCLPHSTVLAAVQCYLENIRSLYAPGPLHLLGHSFGGWIAFELAAQLVDSGYLVETLILIDSAAPPDPASELREYTHTEMILAWRDGLEKLLDHPLNLSRADIESRTESEQTDLLHACMVREHLLPTRSRPEVLVGPLRTFGMALRAQYRPKRPYLGRVQLILVDDLEVAKNETVQGQQRTLSMWRLWAPHLTCCSIAGNHMTVLKPPAVRGLAEIVGGCLGS